jgi:hypothetical protein
MAARKDTYMNIDDITLISGVGDREAKELCVMSLTALIANEPHGDHPVCACPVLTAVAIRVNDANWWESDAERTEALKPLAQAMVGTRNPALALPRAKLFADRALRVWAPAALEAAASVHPLDEHRVALREHAKKLREDGSAAAAADAAAAAARYAAADAAADDAARYAAAAAARYADAARKELRGQVIAAIYEAIALGN